MPPVDPIVAATVALEENLGVVANFLQSAATQLNVIIALSKPSPLPTSVNLQLTGLKNQLTQLQTLVNLV